MEILSARNIIRAGIYLYMMNKKSQQVAPGQNLGAKDAALQNLKRKDGGVILILGRRESGKTILSRRVAQFMGRKTYAISPEEKLPSWITKIAIEEVDDLPPDSTLLLDDLPVYMSSRDYQEAAVRTIERLIPVTRHRKIWLVFISQTSGFADRWVLDADAIFLKQFSLLYADIERPSVKKLMDKAKPHFEDKSDEWMKRHCYLITDSFEGILTVGMVT